MERHFFHNHQIHTHMDRTIATFDKTGETDDPLRDSRIFIGGAALVFLLTLLVSIMSHFMMISSGMQPTPTPLHIFTFLLFASVLLFLRVHQLKINARPVRNEIWIRLGALQFVLSSFGIFVLAVLVSCYKRLDLVQQSYMSGGLYDACAIIFAISALLMIAGSIIMFLGMRKPKTRKA